jgi:hypothetical protein
VPSLLHRSNATIPDSIAYLSEKDETTEGLNAAAVDQVGLGLGRARLVVGNQDTRVVVLGLSIERSLDCWRDGEDRNESCNRGLHLDGGGCEELSQ